MEVYMDENITLENFQKLTGRRFRMNREQSQRFKDGSLTREAAFQEFISNGGLNVKSKKELDLSTLEDPSLSLENFQERTGLRFRVSKDQSRRLSSGEMTREEAFREFLQEKINAKRSIVTG